MLPYLIAISAGILVFALVSLIVSKITKDRSDVYDRISAIKNEQSASDKPKKRVRRKKTNSSALARTKKQLEKLENQIYDVGIKMPVEQFMMIWMGLTIFLPAISTMFSRGVIIPVALAVICAVAPILYINIRKKSRAKQIESQLIDAISIMVNALRAGHSFMQAMNSISQEMEGALAEEFGRVFRETQHGMTLEESMSRMIERTGSDDLNMLCTAILVQREIGGNLSEILQNISGTIQARISLKGEIKTRTASGRLSGYIVGALPIIILVAISVINPGYSDQLLHTESGHYMLIAGGVMEVIGFIVINKIVTIKY